MDILRVAKLLGDSVDQVIATQGHLMPENLADAVAMIDRKIGRDEVAAAPDWNDRWNNNPYWTALENRN